MTFCTERVIYDPRPECPFVVTANRYWDTLSQQQDGFTLVLAHGTGFHKEQWEPTLKYLFSLSKTSSAFPIREAWSIECPNHGESAVINEDAVLRGGYELVFSWGEYTHILYLFLTQNKDIQFSSRKVIAIGHSMGAVSLALTQTYPYAPTFAHIVLCEPMIAPTDAPKDEKLSVGDKMIEHSEQRRDIWPSKKDAYEAFKSRKAFAVWDDEVLRMFVEHGLRELPTGVYPEQKEGVTLKCPKLHEAACYRDSVSARRVYDFLPALCIKLPVHVVWGAIDDSVHVEIKKLVTDAERGRKMSSVSRVQGAGHLIVQTAPKGLAEAIFSAVSQAEAVRSRL